MLETCFDIDITFTSDWHIGIGSGRHGAVDRTIATDLDGLPYVPAKTAIGVLRDGAELAANALDQGVPGVWANWVEAMFGSQPSTGTAVPGRPRPAALITTPLRMPEAQRNYFATVPSDPIEGGVTRTDLINATKVIRTGVMIDDSTGTAAQDTFRVEERARAGITVTASWTIVHPTGDIWPAKFLLLAAARLTRAVGGKRRRGAGSADISLQGLGEMDDYTTGLDSPPLPWVIENSAPTDPSPVARNRSELRHAYDIVITVESPVIVDTGLWGNVVRTARSIPGSMLLPLLRPALSTSLADLIRHDQIVVTDATPDVAGSRGLPWPRALTQSKDASPDDDSYVNVLIEHPENTRLKPRTEQFVNDDCTLWRSVDVTQGIHAVIDDAVQRPTSASGGLFVYEGIAPRTVLRCAVHLPADVELDPASIEGPHRIGRSSKDDYGLVQVSLTAPNREPAATAISAGTSFPVWITSDMLVRNARGGVDTTPEGFLVAIRDALGIDGDVVFVDTTRHEEAPLPKVTESVLTSINRRQTWQRSWGLPRPSLTGLSAGSVFVCTATADISAEAIDRTHLRGVGDRTAEGFGQVRIDAAALKKAILAITKCEPAPPSGSDDTATEPNEHIVSAAWRTVAGRRAVARAATQRRRFLRDNLSRSQLGNLRNVVDGLSRPDGHEAADRWVTRVLSGRRKDNWGSKQLGEIAKLIASDPRQPNHAVWAELGMSPPPLVTPGQHRLLTIFAIQVTMTEMIRFAARNAVQ